MKSQQKQTKKHRSRFAPDWEGHDDDVIMSAMAFQITGVSIVASNASNAENISIWWRHHVLGGPT